MNSDKQNRMNELCQQIQIEQDQTKLGELLRALNDLLDQEQRRPKIPTGPGEVRDHLGWSWSRRAIGQSECVRMKLHHFREVREKIRKTVIARVSMIFVLHGFFF